MKKTHSLLTLALSCILHFSFAQSLNWKTLQASQKHMLHLNLGLDNGTTVEIGYSHRLRTRMPVVLHVGYSTPFGHTVVDDLKTKTGAQINVLRANSLFATVKAYGIFRRFENDLTRMINFGSEFSATAGIYKRRWYAAADIGFDKAIVTHIQHSRLMKQLNPNTETGWYIPTGGNYLVGLQTGYSFKTGDVYAKLGRSFSQNLPSAPALPVYFQLGCTMKWGKAKQ